MFIYHFNRLISSRILWGFFAIIISVAFVAVDSCYQSPQGSAVAGKLNGKKISTETFDQVASSIRGIGRNRDNTTPVREIDRKAWEQIAALQIAENNGLTVGMPEVQNEIQGQNVFHGPNGFDFERYRAILRDQDLSTAQYESLVRHHLQMMKLGALIDAATWISPMELDDELAAMTDKFTVQTAMLSNRFVGVEMRLSDEDFKTFYEENKAQFNRPDRISVRYIAIPVSNYLARVTVPDDNLLDYYDSHMDKFKSSDTNNITGFKPFEDVKDEIFVELQLEEARDCAETNLSFTIFGKALKMDPETILKTIAENENVDVRISPLFSQTEPLFWTSNPKAFANAAFDLDPESADTRFAVVAGGSEMFVIEYHQKSAAHVPPFEEIAEDVKQRAQIKARTDAFDSYVKEIRAEILQQMDSGKAFEDAAKEKALNVSTSLTYTVSEMQMKPFENSYAIAYGAMTLKKGALSEAVPSSMAQSMLIYVADREQGNALDAEMMRSQIRSGMARRRGGALTSDWLKWNLDQQDFHPSRTLDGSSSEDEEVSPELSPRDDDDA